MKVTTNNSLLQFIKLVKSALNNKANTSHTHDDKANASDVSTLQSDVSTLQSDIYFDVGETFTITSGYGQNVQGFITASAKNLYFILPLPKSLENITSVTINSLKCVIRLNPYFTLSGTTLNIVGGNYASGTTSSGIDILTFASSYKIKLCKSLNCIQMIFVKDNTWGCSTNTNCSVEIQSGSFTFN